MQREPQQRIAGVHLVAVEVLGHGGAGDGADDDGEERAEFDDAIAPREALRRKQLRQQAVLRRAEERGLAWRPASSATSESVQRVRGQAGGGQQPWSRSP